MSKSLIPEVVAAAQNRRSFLKKIGAASAAVGAMSVGVAAPAGAQATAVDIEVLNFALNLEYLEAEFYTMGLTGKSITSYGIGINGEANGNNPTSGGTVVGGKQVSFTNNLVFTQAILEQVGADERAHVKLLRSALGSQAIAQPNLNLNALGFGFGSQNEFLKLARIFEDIGVSAYAGAAPLLSSDYVGTAARILAAEAEHTSTIRTQIARLNIPTAPPLDSVDILPPPSGSQVQYLSLNVTTGLCAIRTPQQVLALAYGAENATHGGFFPNGVNGYFTMSGTKA